MDKKEQMINAVIELAQESDGKKKLTCAEVFELAREFEAQVTEIGRICNRHDIKVCKCQLGCFG